MNCTVWYRCIVLPTWLQDLLWCVAPGRHVTLPGCPLPILVSAGFSSSFLRSALAGFVGSSQHLVELLGRKADSGEVVKMHHVAILTTLEIICKVREGC